ncbi:ABC transporter ATP-binding protein [Polyangium jinanense]|uniref:ATP-binding cassette domain-containing protein n=1 Tax=Polyangium jinanense TaxID=2829994 RepID=A0A9X4AU07_9BACT|nr:ATP-binding cassette domain-containing protein [Polyangium jinanense]MDC3957330.1 ATP-binding cassette domain-containing protein [Polyangium jinanense]MDC3982732.1 ATP-binding cassette domain-containing protein [Polyangium jinanense]
MANAPVLYELASVTRTFRTPALDVRALDDVSFTLAEGELAAIAGPSGSGKSTLLAVLGLLDADVSGEVRMRGKSVRRMSRRERARARLEGIGLVFQTFHLLPALDVRHNVALPHWKLHGHHGRALARAEALLAELGLEARMRHDVTRLSGGEMQRVAIARALVNDPAVVLADEPTANLDEASAASVVSLLGRANARGAAVVVCTHDTDLLASFPRVLRLRHGRMVL